MIRLAATCIALALAAAPIASAGDATDHATPGGWFYTQTGLGDGTGYAVTDREDVRMWTFLQDQGGVTALGYPVSQRWRDGPFTYQAFQKAVLQWLPGRGMAFVNIYDRLHAGGLDEWLQTAKNVPPPQQFPEDADQPFGVVMDNHLRLLEPNDAIRERWEGNSNWLNAYGLPVAYKDTGELRVLRAQRAVFQQWMIPTSFTSIGGVVISNGGDHFKQAGQIPEFATYPWLENATEGLTITAFQYDAPGDDRDNLANEFFTLRNDGPPLELTDWQVADQSSHVFTFPTFTLQTGASVTVSTGIGTNDETHLYWGLRSPVWNDTGDTLVLSDPNGRRVIQVAYG